MFEKARADTREEDAEFLKWITNFTTNLVSMQDLERRLLDKPKQKRGLFGFWSKSRSKSNKSRQ